MRVWSSLHRLVVAADDFLPRRVEHMTDARRISVLVDDDEPPARRGLRDLLDPDADVAIVAEAGEFLRRPDASHPCPEPVRNQVRTFLGDRMSIP